MAGIPTFPNIDVETLRTQLTENADMIIIDLLPEDQYEKRHIPGAANVCVYEVVFTQKILEMAPQKDTRIILYGADAETHDARVAAEKLARLSYGNIAVLDGGIAAWRDAGYPLEGKSPDTPLGDPGLVPAKGTYTVDTTESAIEWTGRNPNGKHFGTVKLSSGDIHMARDDFKGRFVIDMKTIQNTNLAGDELQPVLVAHLLSDDFFFVEKYPTAMFTLDNARRVPEGSMSAPNFDVSGSLQLRDATVPLSFSATANSLADGGIAVEAHFDMDRTRWGIIYGSARYFKHLGMHLVYDPISFQVRIVARLQEYGAHL